MERKKSQRGTPKEKVLQIYDKLFQGQDITQGRADFWDDFFLLKANLKCLIAHFAKLSTEDLIRLKPQLNRLFMQCLYTAQHDLHRIRIVNSVQTMNVLLLGVYKCKPTPNCTTDMSEFLLGSEFMKEFMEKYISLCCELIREDRSDRLRSLMFNSMLIFLTTSSSTSCINPFAQSLLDDRIFDLAHLTLISSPMRRHHGIVACKLLGLLFQHRGNKEKNKFGAWICETDDELLLNGISSIVTLALSEFNMRYRLQQESSGGILSSFSSFFSNLITGDISSFVNLKPCDSLLICLLELTKSTDHFTTLFSYSHGFCEENRIFDSIYFTDPVSENPSVKTPSTESMLPYRNNNLPGTAVPITSLSSSIYSNLDRVLSNSSSPTSNHQPLSGGGGGGGGVDPYSSNGELDIEQSVEAVGPTEPRNLLADLLEYCSIIMQDVKSQESMNTCHLCFIIICCITQNRLACALLHDAQSGFKVRIHKPRSRKQNTMAFGIFAACPPMAVAILDLMVDFIGSHLMKKMPYRLYSLCLTICHNLLCYQKINKLRLEVDWKQLWSVILSLLKFVSNMDSHLISLNAAFGLIEKALQLFNFFILYGDAFLQAADIYDSLYYELIRMHSVIENLYEYSLQHTTSTSPEVKDLANAVVLQLGNLRSIVNHFNAKIAAFSTSNNVASLTENQVLEVVRANYDSLTLRFFENLDLFDEFDEKSEDTIMFAMLIDTIFKQIRKDCWEYSLQIQDFLHELSTIQ